MSASRPTHPRRRGRLTAVLTATAALTALAGPLAGGAQASSPLAQLGIKAPTGGAAGLLAHARETAAAQIPGQLAAQTAHRARVASSAWKAERRRSRTAFHGLGAHDALLLTDQKFGDALSAATRVAGADLTAGHVVAWHGTNRATIDPPGPRRRADIVSTGPLRARNAGGQLAPIDLGLQATGTGWAPRNPAVDVALPAHSDGTASVGGIGVTSSLGGDSSPGHAIGDSGVFYADAGTDADLTTTPTLHGLETFFTLRSADAPQDATITLHLPSGAHLLAQDDGSATIVRGTKTLGTVSAPSAVDAQGTPVPTTASVDGDTVTIHTAHQGRDVAYPVLVDPIVDIDSFDPLDVHDWTELSAYDSPWDYPTASDTGSWFGLGGTVAHAGGGDQLQIADSPALTAGLAISGVWLWLPPAGSSHIYSVDFDPYTLDLGGDADATGAAAVFGMYNTEGDAVTGTNADGTSAVSLDDTDEAPETSDGPAVEVILARLTHSPPISSHDHTLTLGDVAVEIDAPDPSELGDGGGPTLDGAFQSDTIGYINTTAVEDFSVSASGPNGVKRIVATIQHGTDPEEEVGDVTDPCAGTVGDPCPSTLDTPFDLDLSSMVVGETYRFRVRAYDADGLRSEAFAINIRLDQTAPTLDLGGDVAALDGLTTSSTATLDLTADTADDDAGMQYVVAEDSASEWSDGVTDCSAGACAPATFHVPLGALSNGTHTITVRAYDNANNETDEHVTFTVTGH